MCTGDDASCAHLYQNIGAVGKIARLPERVRIFPSTVSPKLTICLQCGENAFARISRAWVPEDQSIPENIARRLVKRNGVQPEVKALHIDADFSAVDEAK